MKRIQWTCIFLLLAGTVLQAQNYDVVMPGQRKVTMTDEYGQTKTEIVTDTESDQIYYKEDYYMLKGQKLTEDEFVQKIKAECPPAYEKFQQSLRMKRGSYVMMGVGGAALLVGGGLFAWGGITADYVQINPWQKQLVWNWQMISGLCMMIGGGCTLMGGVIVLLQSAPDCKRQAHKIYNAQCASKSPALTFQYGLTGNGGLGITMSF